MSDKNIPSTQMPQVTAIDIADHLRWKCGPRYDNLLSWSRSVLSLVAHNFYRHLDSSDGSSLHDKLLLVVDNADFPAHTLNRIPILSQHSRNSTPSRGTAPSL